MKCTALQGSYRITDSDRERDFSVRDVVHMKPTHPPPPIQLARGGLRSPWAKSASNYYYYYYYYYYYLLHLGCYPVAVVILHVHKT